MFFFAGLNKLVKMRISIDTKGLTDGENYTLEVYQIKAAMRNMGIKSFWAFFQKDYPTYDQALFHAKINGRGTDKDFVQKLKSVYENQKR